MIPESLLGTAVKAAFNLAERTNGCTNPKSVAETIMPDQNSPLFYKIERKVMRMPTQMYEGGENTLRFLLEQGDSIQIWTQGYPRHQIWKAANAGIGRIRKDILPHEEKSRLTVSAEYDKLSLLQDTITNFASKGLKTIIIVDDKATNIEQTNQTLTKAKTDGAIDRKTNILLI